MTIEEFKAYFEARGGKKGVKDNDQVWVLLIRHYNEVNKGQRGFSKLSFGCGNCRRTAYQWLIKQ